MFTSFNVWLYTILNNIIYRNYDFLCNNIVRRQVNNPNEIPVIIVNYNQLFHLQQLVDFLLRREIKNIVIVDNKSSYPPLLKYYKQIKDKVTVELMDDNFGHAVFFKNKELQRKYGKGFYVLTDADILPNENLPTDFMDRMLKHLKKYWREITKVGFALDISDIPKENILREKILQWEKKFWINELQEGVYEAPLDTTFAMYKPGYPEKYDQISYLNAHRLAKEFIAKHGGWYVDQSNLTEEQKFYMDSASNSSSWLQKDKNV